MVQGELDQGADPGAGTELDAGAGAHRHRSRAPDHVPPMTQWLPRAAHFVRERYFTVDARTLGFFRICFGLHLIAHLYDPTKGPDPPPVYTKPSVMPKHHALLPPHGDH